MNLEEYIKLSANTEPKNLYGIRDSLYHLTHACLGLSTELAELIVADGPVNEAEELGDLCWYAAIPMRVLCISAYPVLLIDRDVAGTNNIAVAIGDFTDFIKRDFAWSKEYDVDKFASATFSIWNALYSYSDLIGVPMPIIFDANIAKLAKRFPNKFNLEDALVRDLVVERKVLESFFSKRN